MIERYASLPNELKALHQWCISGPDKSPHVAVNGQLVRARVNSGPWMGFSDAVAVAGNGQIGFILTADDPYSVIDMDVADAENTDKQFTPREILDQFSSVVTLANSYAELSASRKGLHVWVKGDIGDGLKGAHFELYSKNRFMICTGAVVSQINYRTMNNVAIPVLRQTIVGTPIKENQQLLETLALEIKAGRKTNNSIIPLNEVAAIENDDQIWQRAKGADNADKFIRLCEGEWQAMGFPSQSEADLALLSMFTFYTQSNEQVLRLFRQTKLGERDKANKNDVYLNRTVASIRAREENEKQSSVTINVQALEESSRIRNETKQDGIKNLIAEMQAVKIEKVNATIDASIVWPPGIIGQVAAYIYYSSPRPVVEVAIVAALGFFAGVCGKAYHTESQSGLNLYIILIARSAIGKEAMHTGISMLINQLESNGNPVAHKFVNFTDFASGPALIKACQETPSFLNISGEWGKKLKRLAYEDMRDGPMQQLRTVMTNLYQKSGPGATVGGITYSKSVENVDDIKTGVAYSMIGETTPGTFYESLTDSMMEDGFLSRFTIVQFDGDRPAANNNQLLLINNELRQYVSQIIANAAKLTDLKQSQTVLLDAESTVIFNDYDLKCDAEIRNAGKDEALRQMWNRAHLKALRIASLFAVADNFTQPIINAEQCNWAINLIQKDIAIMYTKIEGGDIGLSDDTRIRKLVSVIQDFIRGPVPDGYNINKELIKNSVIPRKYLHYRVSQFAAFNKHRLGVVGGLDMTIKAAIDCGYIVEIDKFKLIELYGFQGRCYQAVNLPIESTT